MSKAVVLETNVLATANGRAEHAGNECMLASIQILKDIKFSKVVLHDSKGKILSEYKSYASFSGQPGTGDAFFKWLWDNQANPKHCRLVDITPKADDPDDFEEFPNDPTLSSFDRSDRKFVAVVKASPLKAKIINATDTDWWNYRRTLKANGINVDFICPDLMR